MQPDAVYTGAGYVIHNKPTCAGEPIDRTAVGDAETQVAIMLAFKMIEETLMAR